MEKAVVIVAGGSGSRMQSNLPKQFISIKGKPVIIYTLEKFLNACTSIKVVIVCHSEYINFLETLLRKHVNQHPAYPNISVVEGGASRFLSSFAGLQNIPFKQGLVAIHDAARPFVKPSTIQHCFQCCAEKGNAIPSISVTDTIRQLENESSSLVDRSVLRKVQTPQCFQLSEILEAYNYALNNSNTQKPQFTDDASVLEFYGKPVFLCEGQTDNIKITTPFDLKLAELMI